MPISIVIIFLSNPHNTSLLINIHTISFFQKMAERSDNPLTLHRLWSHIITQTDDKVPLIIPISLLRYLLQNLTPFYRIPNFQVNIKRFSLYRYPILWLFLGAHHGTLGSIAYSSFIFFGIFCQNSRNSFILGRKFFLCWRKLLNNCNKSLTVGVSLVFTYTKGVAEGGKCCGHIGSQRMERLVSHHNKCRTINIIGYFFSQHLQSLK